MRLQPPLLFVSGEQELKCGRCLYRLILSGRVKSQFLYDTSPAMCPAPQINNETEKNELLDSLRSLVYSSNSLIVSVVLLNFVFLFTRPQDIFSFLGHARIPLVITLFAIAAWVTHLNKNWTKQTKIMAIFLVAEALRNFLGKAVFDHLVENDFWAFRTWLDLTLQFLGTIFPLVVFFASGSAIRRLVGAWLLIPGFLAFYALTHHGTGPGGFVYDENDLGLVLLTFLPLPLALITECREPGRSRAVLLGVSGAIIAAVIVTFSRGAFVGMTCVLLSFFWRSRKKFMLLGIGTAVLLVTVPLLPQEYLDRIRSIKDTNEGTADKRRHYWDLAYRVWKDPKHTLIGVGMGNVTYHLSNYETAEDLAHYPGSAGRAVHSIYFQLLPDLGIWGIFVVGGVVLISYRSNSRNSKLIDHYNVLLAEAIEHRRSIKPGADEDDESAEAELLELLESEFDYIQPFFMAMNLSFVAIFTSGAFISVLYYPMLWLAAGVSAMLDLYVRELDEIGEEMVELKLLQESA